jgi:hypothetical protein
VLCSDGGGDGAEFALGSGAAGRRCDLRSGHRRRQHGRPGRDRHPRVPLRSGHRYRARRAVRWHRATTWRPTGPSRPRHPPRATRVRPPPPSPPRRRLAGAARWDGERSNESAEEEDHTERRLRDDHEPAQRAGVWDQHRLEQVGEPRPGAVVDGIGDLFPDRIATVGNWSGSGGHPKSGREPPQ